MCGHECLCGHACTCPHEHARVFFQCRSATDADSQMEKQACIHACSHPARIHVREGIRSVRAAPRRPRPYFVAQGIRARLQLSAHSRRVRVCACAHARGDVPRLPPAHFSFRAWVKHNPMEVERDKLGEAHANLVSLSLSLSRSIPSSSGVLPKGPGSGADEEGGARRSTRRRSGLIQRGRAGSNAGGRQTTRPACIRCVSL